MAPKDYRPLITSLERQHAVTPERYRIKVVMLAVAGFAYLGGLVCLALAGLTGLVQAIIGAEALLALRALIFCSTAMLLLWPLLAIRPQAPEGRAITAREAPKLFALLGKIRNKIKGTRIHEVLISGEFELCTIQTPRIGVIGWQRNTLVIGLPLLQILSRKEFAALLTHEFEHLGGTYGKISAWIYRVRLHWARVLRAAPLASRSLSNIAWIPLRGFVPYFEAYSFVMARQNEYLADRLGGQIVGKRLMADALISRHLGQQFLKEQFWPNLWAQTENSDRPAFPPHSLLRTALNAGTTESLKEAWLQAAIKQTSTTDDTQPCLGERLLALDQRPELPPTATQNAAQVLIGETLPDLLKEFDANWLKANVGDWETRYRAIAEAREIVEMFSRCKPSDLLAQDQCKYGLALRQLGHTEEALSLLQLAADSPQGSGRAAMAVAEILHDGEDETAIHYLEMAMRKDARLAPDATAQAADFYQKRGDHDKARIYWARLNQIQTA